MISQEFFAYFSSSRIFLLHVSIFQSSYEIIINCLSFKLLLFVLPMQRSFPFTLIDDEAKDKRCFRSD